MQAVVIDTNVVLDLFVFKDPVAAPLRASLLAGHVRWLATAAMRDELARVLGYAHIVRVMSRRSLVETEVLVDFDRYSSPVGAAASCGVRCRDPDDQPFIDLAVAHGALLLSKDKAVLATARRVATRGAEVAHPWQQGLNARAVAPPPSTRT